MELLLALSPLLASSLCPRARVAAAAGLSVAPCQSSHANRFACAGIFVKMGKVPLTNRQLE